MIDLLLPWGDSRRGGNSSAVRDQLTGVRQIQSTLNGAAFAAIVEDGSVVTWGSESCGGDSSAVRDQLKGVQQISIQWWGLCCDSGRWIRRFLG